MLSLRFRYEPMTIHAGIAKGSQGQLRYTVGQSYDDTVILQIIRAAQRFNTVLVGLCAEGAITKDRRICHFLSDHSTKSVVFNSIFLDEIIIFSKKIKLF